jgi:transcriptional regulator of arginine metabolism
MSKTARHKAILDLLDESPVESQDLLQHRLERKGFEVGQATLSRDIHELKLVKGAEGYRRADESLSAESVLPSVMRLVHEFVVEIRQAQNLLVVKTAVGSAQPVAAALDASHWPEVVGTLAGDDTVLVIAANKKGAHALARRMSGLSSQVSGLKNSAFLRPKT